MTLRPGPGLRLPSPPGRAQGIQVTRKAHAGDVMASAEGAAGPAPGVRHQPAGGVHPNSVSNRLIPSTESALHQRWWCSGMNSCAVCMRFWVRIWRFSLFCQFRYTELYRVYCGIYLFYLCIDQYISVYPGMGCICFYALQQLSICGYS